ncbi:MAG: hypothetical protein HYU66_11990 [Armatimonadetes bacterium]|nr:hypothetical protein [Armatimonadota bacterium]
MAAARPFVWILACFGAALPALAAERALPPPVVEPLDLHAGEWWQDPAPEVTIDRRRGELRPTRPGVPAALVFLFRPTAPGPSLAVLYSLRLGGPGGQARWDVSPDGGLYVPVAGQTWRDGRYDLDLSPWLRAGQPLFVRLTLQAAQRPDEVAVGGLAWRMDGVARVRPAAVRLPRSCWLYDAWVARALRRRAPGRAPSTPVSVGTGRLTRAIAADWTPLPDARGWLAGSWSTGRIDGARTRLLVAAGGPHGGRLLLDGTVVAEHDLPGMPLGLELTRRNTPSGPLPPLAVEGGEPSGVKVVDLGLLELRHVAPRTEFSPLGTVVWVDAVVVNHGAGDIEGNLRGTLTGPEGGPAAVSACGYRFPPGAWLATLAFEVDEPLDWAPGRPRLYRAEVSVDDGAQVSDAATLPVGLRAAVRRDGEWWLGAQRLAPARPASDLDQEPFFRALAGHPAAYARLAAPVSETLLDLADRLGVPVVIETPPERPDVQLSEELLHGGRPAVMGVQPGEP